MTAKVVQPYLVPQSFKKRSKRCDWYRVRFVKSTLFMQIAVGHIFMTPCRFGKRCHRFESKLDIHHDDINQVIDVQWYYPYQQANHHYRRHHPYDGCIGGMVVVRTWGNSISLELTFFQSSDHFWYTLPIIIIMVSIIITTIIITTIIIMKYFSSSVFWYCPTYQAVLIFMLFISFFASFCLYFNLISLSIRLTVCSASPSVQQ